MTHDETAPPTGLPGVRTGDLEEPRCEQCGGPLGPRRPGARYCSPRCRAADHRARHRAELLAALDQVEQAARRLRQALEADAGPEVIRHPRGAGGGQP